MGYAHQRACVVLHTTSRAACVLVQPIRLMHAWQAQTYPRLQRPTIPRKPRWRQGLPLLDPITNTPHVGAACGQWPQLTCPLRLGFASYVTHWHADLDTDIM